jgi:hypothetical protein
MLTIEEEKSPDETLEIVEVSSDVRIEIYVFSLFFINSS